MSELWSRGFWALPPLSLCCESCWCPCVLFGRTHGRTQGSYDGNDCNPACMFYLLGCFTGACQLCAWAERHRIRHQYNIQGDMCRDFCASACCTNNVLIQCELESIARNRQEPYRTVEGMTYGV
ncbi:PLAC8 family protein [Aspergillus californicus]